MAQLVSVLIDTYNHGPFIEKAVESVLSQDFPAEQLEVLVVDDGSNDDTARRASKYASRVRYLRKQNGGQASALNFGLAQTRGDIVAFLDADDYWVQGKLKRTVEEFEAHPKAATVYHGFVTLENDGTFRSGELQGESGYLPTISDGLLRFDFHPTSALAFRRSVLERILPIPEELVIQADAYLFACAVFVAPVFYTPEEFTVYRIHAGNLWNAAGEENDEKLLRRLNTRRALKTGVRGWLERNGFDTDSGHLKTFLLQWELASEREEFKLKPPGRLQFMRHLLKYPRFYGVRMTWRHKMVSYVNGFGSLLTGYEHYGVLDGWRAKVKQTLFGKRTQMRQALDIRRET